MEFKTTVKVAGVFSSAGQLPDGKTFDFTKVVVLNEVKDGRGFGLMSVLQNWGDSTNAAKFSTIPLEKFPVLCEATYTIAAKQTGGKGEAELALKDLVLAPTQKN